PLAKGFAAPAMYQQHCGEGTVTLRPSVIGKDACCLPLIGFTLVIELLRQISPRSPGRRRHAAKLLQIPGTGKTMASRRRATAEQCQQERPDQRPSIHHNLTSALSGLLHRRFKERSQVTRAP